MRLPCGNNGLNASLELDDTNLRLFVQIRRLDVEQIGPSSQAICLAFIVKCVEYLHYRSQVQMLASQPLCLLETRVPSLTPHGPDGYSVLGFHSTSIILTISKADIDRSNLAVLFGGGECSGQLVIKIGWEGIRG